MSHDETRRAVPASLGAGIGSQGFLAEAKERGGRPELAAIAGMMEGDEEDAVQLAAAAHRVDL